jgi:hypothetical protein
MSRVLGMVVRSLHRIIGCVGELSLLVIFPCFVVQNNRGVDNLAKPKPEPTLPPEIGVANEYDEYGISTVGSSATCINMIRYYSATHYHYR